jgi:hypothetical protein
VRRVIGRVACCALIVASSSAIGATATLPLPVSRVDLGSQLMLRLFGETSDSSASFAAAQGDRTSESPLRDLALQVTSADDKPSFAPSSSVAFERDRLALRDLAPAQPASFLNDSAFDAGSSLANFAAPSPSNDQTGLAQPDVHFTAAYQPVPPMPTISPAPGTLAFVAPDVRAADFLPATTQIGNVRLEGHPEDAPVQTPQLDSTSGSYDAGANFDVRAGKRSLNVNLSSEYQHVGDNDTGSLALSPPGSASGLQLPGSAVPLTLPNDGDVNRLSLGAGVSVPVVRGLTLNLNYDAQRLYGGYGLPGLLNLETVNNTYGGKLTFNIPQISSSLSVGAYQDRFQDGSILPVNGTTDTRADVNFTVKF